VNSILVLMLLTNPIQGINEEYPAQGIELDPNPAPNQCRCLEWACPSDAPCTCKREMCPTKKPRKP
jgi:hypothetical protein